MRAGNNSIDAADRWSPRGGVFAREDSRGGYLL